MAMQQKRRHAKRRTNKAKICRFCENHVNYIDFKDGEQLRRFQTEKGRILPRHITGTCLNHQKMLSTALKRARIISVAL